MDVNDICSMSYKILIKEIEDDSKSGKIYYALWLEELIFLNGYTTKSNLQI